MSLDGIIDFIAVDKNYRKKKSLGIRLAPLFVDLTFS